MVHCTRARVLLAGLMILIYRLLGSAVNTKMSTVANEVQK
jgi:hypothetical protein